MVDLTYDARGIRTVKSDDKGYSGLTAVHLGKKRERVVMSVGADVEAMLLASVAERV